MAKKELKEKDLQKVSGGASNFYYRCTACLKNYSNPGNCPVCGKQLLAKPKPMQKWVE